MTEKNLVCRAEEIVPGFPRIVKIRTMSIGLFRVGDDIHAMLNICPHKGAPLCEGPQCGTTAWSESADFISHRDDEIVRCAWHGWEFDIRSGASLVNPNVRARTFSVTVEGGDVYVHA
jgi:nitrite reductase/ring-hydroxylating ferredoxin subunit